MSEINYQALREAAQNYQSTLAWYEAIADNPNAEQDCNEAVAAFKRQIRHQEMDIIAELLEELETKDNRIAELEKIATDHALKF
ncbi:ead/Ea22-like family protein [Salmonella enterica]|nr:ead/Ea22-like family protein [Salmonella enterica]ELD9242536.1 ead/Ea22-like family protein [Salmonella enterica]